MANRSDRNLVSGISRSAGFESGMRLRREAGSALLLVLFAIILLTGLITATVAFVSVDVDEYEIGRAHV